MKKVLLFSIVSLVVTSAFAGGSADVGSSDVNRLQMTCPGITVSSITLDKGDITYVAPDRSVKKLIVDDSFLAYPGEGTVLKTIGRIQGSNDLRFVLVLNTNKMREHHTEFIHIYRYYAGTGKQIHTNVFECPEPIKIR